MDDARRSSDTPLDSQDDSPRRPPSQLLPDFATRLPLAATLLLVAFVWSGIRTGRSIPGPTVSFTFDVVPVALALAVIFVCMPCLRRGPIGGRLAAIWMIVAATLILGGVITAACVAWIHPRFRGPLLGW